MNPDAEALNKALRSYVRDRMLNLETENMRLRIALRGSRERATLRMAAIAAALGFSFNGLPPFSEEQLRA